MAEGQVKHIFFTKQTPILGYNPSTEPYAPNNFRIRRT